VATHDRSAAAGRAPAARAGMTADEMRTWRSLLDTTAELRSILGAQLQGSGLSAADYAVLLALSEADGRRLRASALAATINWERSRLSHHLGRMERRGLIRRDECATDNRGAEVSRTPAGADVFRRASAPHLREVQRRFADALTPAQFEALADVLDAIGRHLHPRSSAQAGGVRS